MTGAVTARKILQEMTRRRVSLIRLIVANNKRLQQVIEKPMVDTIDMQIPQIPAWAKYNSELGKRPFQCRCRKCFQTFADLQAHGR